MTGDKYYQGKPCKYGHSGLRYKSTGSCVECTISAGKQWFKENREKAYQRYREWYANNAQYDNERTKVWHDNNKERMAELNRQWRTENKSAVTAHSNKRRAAKLQRTPAWANLEAIAEIYKNCPSNKVVDHIYPLQGEEVSGLHVAGNLQYLTLVENSTKHNKVDPKLLEWVIYAVSSA